MKCKKCLVSLSMKYWLSRVRQSNGLYFELAPNDVSLASGQRHLPKFCRKNPNWGFPLSPGSFTGQ